MQGWVKIHRKFQNWEWRDSPKHVAVFLDLLLEANHKDNSYRGVNIKAGSLTTSYQAISARTGVSVRSVRTVLRDLKTTNEVTHKTTRHYSIISIANWDSYQLDDTQADKLVTSKRQASDKLVTTNKNVKNVKNVKNTYSDDYVALFQDNEIISWIKETGNEKIQDDLKSKYPSDFIIEETEKAYYWQLENKKRNAGTFLKGWLDRSNNPKKINKEAELRKIDIVFLLKQGIDPKEFYPDYKGEYEIKTS